MTSHNVISTEPTRAGRFVTQPGGHRAFPRAFPERPVIVATKDKLERRTGYALVPAALLLWALG